MSLFDALKAKDNPYGIPLLTAGLSILANNRGDTAGMPAIFSGFKDGLSMYGQDNDRREKARQQARLQNVIDQHYGNSGQQSTNQFAPPAADGAVQSLSDFKARQSSPAFSAGAQGGLPMAQAQPQEMAQQPSAYGVSPQQNGHSMRELVSKLAMAGMSPDNIGQLLPVLAKTLPEYQAQNMMVRGSDGQPQYLMANNQGDTTMLPYAVAGKQNAVDLGGRSVMVDEYTGKPSTAFDKSESPDARSRANVAYRVASMNNQKDMDIAELNNKRAMEVEMVKQGFPIQGNGSQNGAPDLTRIKLTEAQARATKLAPRMVNANQSLDQMPPLSWNDQIALMTADTPLNILSSVVGPTIQEYLPAMAAFAAGDKYDVSGAAITEAEWKNAIATYIPLAGDTPEKLKAKALNRQIAIQSTMSAAGPYAADRVKMIMENANTAHQSHGQPVNGLGKMDFTGVELR